MPHQPWRMVDLGPIGNGPPIETSLSPAETAWLCWHARGRRVLETGTGRGYSAIAMALAGAAYVASVDDYSMYSRNHLAGYIEDYQLQTRISMIEGDSRQVLPELFLAGCEYDLIFIDGDHSKAVAQSDIRWAYHLISGANDQGMIAVHDYAEECCVAEVGPAVDALVQVRGVIDTMAVFSKANYFEEPAVIGRGRETVS